MAARSSEAEVSEVALKEAAEAVSKEPVKLNNGKASNTMIKEAAGVVEVADSDGETTTSHSEIETRLSLFVLAGL